MFPELSTATDVGPARLALTAGTPSPAVMSPCWSHAGGFPTLKPKQPLPATVVMTPPTLTLRIRLSKASATKILPEPSSATDTPWTEFKLAFMAGDESPL